MKLENYKVRVSNESESKEVQELFEQLGFRKGICTENYFPYLIIAHDDYSSKCGDLNSFHSYKELTIQQLRDLVVLHRNNREDANVYQDGDIKCLYDLLS